MTNRLLLILIAASFIGSAAEAQDLDVRLATDSDREREARTQLLRLVDEFDVRPWIFTHRIVIEGGVIPHSHPVLTLNTRHLGDDRAALSTFLHEQIHWSVNADSIGAEGAIGELRRRYPEVPVGNPDGARSEFSTYLHLVVCWLELDAMTHFIGASAARALLADQTHYRWIYAQVLTDAAAIGEIIRRHGLVVQPGL